MLLQTKSIGRLKITGDDDYAVVEIDKLQIHSCDNDIDRNQTIISAFDRAVAWSIQRPEGRR